MSNRRPPRYGKTTTMDTKNLHQPVISELPVRGRDMITRDFTTPTGTPSTSRRARAETFHEGYIEDKRYLVPDSTLKAMADIINLKMRKSELPRNKMLSNPRDHSDGVGWWDRRRESLINKLDDFSLPEEEKEKFEEEKEQEKEEEEEEEVEEEEKEGEEEEKLEEEEEDMKEEKEDEEEEKEMDDEVEEESAGEGEDMVEEKEDAEYMGEDMEEEEVEEEEEEEEEEEKEEELQEEEEEESEDEENVEDENISKETTEVEDDKAETEVAEDDESVEEEEDEGEVAEEEDSEREEEETEDEYEEQLSNLEDVEEGEDGLEETVGTLVNKEILEKRDETEKGTIDDTIYPDKYYDPNVQRFLISGHFRTNRKPIYIIHQYAGPPVFSAKDPQFHSHKSEEDADIFIAGEFYKETILEEDENGRPKMLNTKPRRIFVDSSSKIYETEFKETFVGKDLDVELSGSFVRHADSPVYTPVLTLSLKRGVSNATKEYSGQHATPVYVSRSLMRNIFQSWRRFEANKTKVSFSNIGNAARGKPRNKTPEGAGARYDADSSEMTDLLPRPDAETGGRTASKLSQSRTKRGNDPSFAVEPEVPVFLSRPEVETPFASSNEKDANRSRYPKLDGSRAPESFQRESSEKRSPFRSHGRGKGEESVVGAGRKRVPKSQTSLTSTEKCETEEQNPVYVDIKWNIERREKKSTAKRLLDRFFQSNKH